MTAGDRSSRILRLAPGSTDTHHTLCCSCKGPLEGGSQWDSSPPLPPPFLYFLSNHGLLFCILCFSSCRPSGEKKPAEPKAMPDLSGYQIRV